MLLDTWKIRDREPRCPDFGGNLSRDSSYGQCSLQLLTLLANFIYII
jgi:hypothetical protein